MEFSENEVEPNGQDLIQKIVSLTGLPEPWARSELDEILEHYGQNSKNLTLNQLREVLAAYLDATQMDFMGDPRAPSE